MSESTLLIERFDHAIHVTLNRPNTRNAMSLVMVNELRNLFTSLQDDRTTRAVVIRGSNGHFCAGADIRDLTEGRAKSAQAGVDSTQYLTELNRAFGHLMTQANHLPQTLITVLEGAVLGGGFGLACVSDVGIALQSAQFGLPETGLGIIPAQIAPFVVQRIGITQARRLMLLGERFNGEDAVRLGLAHFLATDNNGLKRILNDVLGKVKRCAPEANRITKALIHRVGNEPLDPLLDDAARAFANAALGEEGAEGTMAFVQKRLPRWAQ